MTNVDFHPDDVRLALGIRDLLKPYIRDWNTYSGSVYNRIIESLDRERRRREGQQR